MNSSRTLRPRRALALGALMLLAGAMPACGSSTAPSDVIPLRDEYAVVIRNRTNAPMFTFVVGRQAAALVDWFPCVDAVRCPPIMPGRAATRTVNGTLERIREREALVYWWHAVGRPDGTVGHDSVRYVVVELK